MPEDQYAPPPYTLPSSGLYQFPNASQNDTPGARPPLIGNIHEARTRHLDFIVHSFILPSVKERAVVGISHTQITLIPLTAARGAPIPEIEPDPFANTTEARDVHDEDEVVQIQLQSAIDTPRFWRQKSVLDELRRLIKAALVQNHDDTVPDTKVAEEILPSRERVNRKSRPQKEEHVVVPERDGIVVKVDLEDVCVRTVNSFGLYESSTKEGVLVEVALER